VEIHNDLGFQVSSGLKANHSVVVISWGMKMDGWNTRFFGEGLFSGAMLVLGSVLPKSS